MRKILIKETVWIYYLGVLKAESPKKLCLEIFGTLFGIRLVYGLCMTNIYDDGGKLFVSRDLLYIGLMKHGKIKSDSSK